MSEYQHHGTLAGGFDFSTSSVKGKKGRALSFDGLDDAIDLGVIQDTDPLMLTQSEFSIAVWIKKVGNAAQRIIDKSNGNSAANGYALWATNTRIGLLVKGTPIAEVNLSPDSLTDDWHHVAVTLEESQAQIFVDGCEVLSVAGGMGGFPLPPEAEVAMRIGDISSSGSRYFEGSMDDLRVYNRVLSAGEILEVCGPDCSCPP